MLRDIENFEAGSVCKYRRSRKDGCSGTICTIVSCRSFRVLTKALFIIMMTYAIHVKNMYDIGVKSIVWTLNLKPQTPMVIWKLGKIILSFIIFLHFLLCKIGLQGSHGTLLLCSPCLFFFAKP